MWCIITFSFFDSQKTILRCEFFLVTGTFLVIFFKVISGCKVIVHTKDYGIPEKRNSFQKVLLHLFHHFSKNQYNTSVSSICRLPQEMIYAKQSCCTIDSIKAERKQWAVTFWRHSECEVKLFKHHSLLFEFCDVHTHIHTFTRKCLAIYIGNRHSIHANYWPTNPIDSYLNKK